MIPIIAWQFFPENLAEASILALSKYIYYGLLVSTQSHHNVGLLTN